MKSQTKNKTLLIIVLALISGLFLLQKACGVDVDELAEVQPSDTVLVEAIPDTVIIHDTISITVTKPVPYEVYIDTVDTLLSVVNCDSVRAYVSEYSSDSGFVSVTSKVKGEILEQSVDYAIRTMVITDVDTVVVTTPAAPSKKPVFSAGAGFTNRITPFLYGTMYYNRKSVIVGYNLIDQNVSVGVGIMFGKDK